MPRDEHECIPSVDPRRRGRCVRCDRPIKHYLQPEPDPEPEESALFFSVGETVELRFKEQSGSVAGRVTMDSPTMVGVLGAVGYVVIPKAGISGLSRTPQWRA